MEVIAEDWCQELKDFPAWAIAKAVRWWTGRNNPERRKKPLAGDIAAQAQTELGPLFVAQSAIKRFDNGTALAIEETPRQPVSKERAAELMKEIGFNVKKIEQE